MDRRVTLPESDRQLLARVDERSMEALQAVGRLASEVAELRLEMQVILKRFETSIRPKIEIVAKELQEDRDERGEEKRQELLTQNERLRASQIWLVRTAILGIASAVLAIVGALIMLLINHVWR